MSDTTSTPPNGGEQHASLQPNGAQRLWLRLTTGQRITAVAVLIAAFAGFAWFAASIGGGAGGAAGACQDYVDSRLKAPSTAEYRDTVQRQDDDGNWVVSGTVDAENSFGAMIANTYTCTVTDKSGDWELVDLAGPS